MTAAEKIAEARRLAAASVESFRRAAKKERECRGAGWEERVRVFSEAVAEEVRAIEQLNEAIELQLRAVQAQPSAFHAEPSPKAKPEPNVKKRGRSEWQQEDNTHRRDHYRRADDPLRGFRMGVGNYLGEYEERQHRMTAEQMSEALDAIHDEALKLARRDDLTEEVEDGLNLIILLSRHKYDVRNEKEKQAGGEP
jgi:hypothetical protein